MSNSKKNPFKNPFNSAIESGLRTLSILEKGYPNRYALQRLIFYDYLLVHSGDVKDGPESLHPATPHRSAEFIIKRDILENGIILMTSRKLIIKIYDKKGIFYKSSDLATPFLDDINSEYVKLLKSRAMWVVSYFRKYSDRKLKKFFNDNLDRWGGEFEKKALLK